ncbi:galacturonan 1,4-alpha-galacturonidase [Salvia divinorum]|uniref:Galacturonan 1,4-alpha-galacturonidase n=1 Tax=Salvia divinorum TaxID=28513 RepID=A0ABD1HZG7_SALDI
MNSQSICSWIYMLLLFLFNWNIVDVFGQSNNFVVTNFGALADGITDSKQAFADAWKKACQTPGGIVTVPTGKTFLVSIGEFEGPCNGQTLLQMDGTLVASEDSKLDDTEFWITFHKIDDLVLCGTGIFDGKGALSWSHCDESSSCHHRPASLRIHAVTNANIQGITSLNSKMFHFQIHNSQNVNVENIRITAPHDSPNTDGIHISNSRDVKIVNSIIGTGDDCISLGDGCTNVNISGVACGPGHGISIGSLGKYSDEEDISGITVTNCSLSNTTNGLRIKTWAPSKSSIVVSDITYADITLDNVKNPIIIDQHYCPHDECQNKGESSVQIKGVKYINVRGSSATEDGIEVQCSKLKPCEDVEFCGVELKLNGGPTIANCSNVGGQFLESNPSCHDLLPLCNK